MVKKVLIVYYSKTGHTKKMAEAIARGSKKVKGVEVILKSVENASNKDLLEADAIVLGSPSYFRLPAWPIKKFIDESIEIYGRLGGKIGGVFSSAGGEKGAKICIQGLKDMLEEHGIKIIGEGVYAIELPNEQKIKECEKYGEIIAEHLIK
ncbi:MAG: flavodoxin family protein [Candidatus Baldrarchaeia archaeon]